MDRQWCHNAMGDKQGRDGSNTGESHLDGAGKASSVEMYFKLKSKNEIVLFPWKCAIARRNSKCKDALGLKGERRD